MKLIKAIIKPERFEALKNGLEENGYYGMTVTDVKGRGDQRGITLQYRGGSIQVDLIPKIQVEIVAKEKDVEVIIEIIRSTAKTGKIGDGRIFVIPVDQSIKVRTGEPDFD